MGKKRLKKTNSLCFTFENVTHLNNVIILVKIIKEPPIYQKLKQIYLRF